MTDLHTELVLRLGHLPTCGERAEFPWDCTCDYAGAMERFESALSDGERWRAAEDEGHIVTFTEDGYGLQHPPSCRPDLIGCRYNAAAIDALMAAKGAGR